MTTHPTDLYTLDEALKRLRRRDFQHIYAHVSVDLPLNDGTNRHFSSMTYLRLSRAQAARFLRSAWSDKLAERGGRLKLALHDGHHQSLWIG